MTFATRLGRLLANPIVDKTLAVIVVTPVAFAIYGRLAAGQLDIVKINLVLQGVLAVITMLVRRAPARVSVNPLYWFLSFLASYWVPFPALDKNPGIALVPEWIGVALSCLGLWLTVYSRLSLGRNVGMIPAQRRLVVTGAYRFVRHPIYAAGLLGYVAVLLLHYTTLHLVLVALGILWFVLRSLVEERFLESDPTYAIYMSRVRKRFIPGLI